MKQNKSESKAQNKQRLVLLSKKEKRAAITGGAVDETVPKEKLQRRLKDEGIDFQIEPILQEVGVHAGRVRGYHVPGMGVIQPDRERLKPSEIKQQARATCAVIDELRERLDNLHPEIDCWVNEVLYNANNEFLNQAMDRIEPDLLRIRAAIDNAGKKVGMNAGRTGPKSSEWSNAREAIASALRDYSKPTMSEKAALGLAQDLLQICGLKSPRKPRGSR